MSSYITAVRGLSKLRTTPADFREIRVGRSLRRMSARRMICAERRRVEFFESGGAIHSK